MHPGWLAEIHLPCICEDDITVIDLFPGRLLYNLIGEKDPIPDVSVDRVAQRIFGL